MSTHKHWLLWAYESREGDHLHDVTALDVLAGDWDEALRKARELYRPTGAQSGYLLKSVVEHLDGACVR